MAILPGRRANRVSAQEFRVVSQHPLSRWLWGIAVAAICILGVFGGYRLGNSKTGLDASYVASLEALKAANFEQISKLQGQVVAMGLNQDVDSQTAQELRLTIKSMRDEIAQRAEEVTFYKSLMAPSELPRGLQIADFEVQPTITNNQFTFHLLLTQVESRRDWIQGDIDLLIHGRDQQVLSLTEIAGADTYPLKFRFRYFQDLSGIIILPEDFEPASVEISARRRGASATDLAKSFAWRESEDAEKEFRN
jgi:hypothetical protein